MSNNQHQLTSTLPSWRPNLQNTRFFFDYTLVFEVCDDHPRLLLTYWHQLVHSRDSLACYEFTEQNLRAQIFPFLLSIIYLLHLPR